MNFSLNLEQSQKLIMTPELRQAIEILQYNSLELGQFVHEELMTNPVLELTDKETDGNYNNEGTDNTESQQLQGLTERVDWLQVISQDEKFKSTYQKQEDHEEFTMDNMVAEEESLHEYLLSQLQFTVLTVSECTVGEYLIENVDGAGYLRIEPDEVLNRFGYNEDQLEDVIQTLQTFEPYGVCARDLQECLLIQVQMRGLVNQTVIRIIENHLEDLANNRLKNIAKALNLTELEIQKATDIIKGLDPKPGLRFSSLRDVKYVVPDVTVTYHDGEYTILVNDSTAPKLQISDYYKTLLKSAATEEATADYIHQKLNNALKLIRSIEQRRNTIYRVVESILKYQADFFDKGTMYLRVLNLKDVAEDIGVHESTVSRAVNGKYLQCPRGLFEIKYFFQSGVSSAYGDGISSETIKSIIKDLVDKEDPKKPLSDQDITQEIDKAGIKVSRRTIAKYREEMHIPGSSKRKRY